MWYMHYVYATWCYSTIGCIVCCASFDTKVIVDHNISWRIFDRPLQKKRQLDVVCAKVSLANNPTKVCPEDPGRSQSLLLASWCGVISWSKTVENVESMGNCEKGVWKLLLNRHLGAAFAWGVGFGSVSISNLRTHSGGAKGIWFTKCPSQVRMPVHPRPFRRCPDVSCLLRTSRSISRMASLTHRIHVWYIYANIGGILMGSMLPYIAAPWILWVIVYGVELVLGSLVTMLTCAPGDSVRSSANGHL